MKPKGCYWTTAHYTENTMRSVTVKVRKLNKNVEQWLLSGFHPDHVYFYWLWFKAGFHLGNFPQVRNGQGSFLCVRALAPTESSQDKGNFSVRSRPEENYPEWKPVLNHICKSVKMHSIRHARFLSKVNILFGGGSEYSLPPPPFKSIKMDFSYFHALLYM